MDHQLRFYGDPVLRVRSEEIAELTPEVISLAKEMMQVLHRERGAGLSAVQIGIPIRLFVYCLDDYHPDGRIKLGTPHYIINPNIVAYSDEHEIAEEGCLSIPGIRVPVARPIHLKVAYTDLDGQLVEREIDDAYECRAFCHETDHLNGVLNVDRVKGKLKRQVDAYLQKLKKKYSQSR